jgi:hypothetical protein
MLMSNLIKSILFFLFFFGVSKIDGAWIEVNCCMKRNQGMIRNFKTFTKIALNRLDDNTFDMKFPICIYISHYSACLLRFERHQGWYTKTFHQGHQLILYPLLYVTSMAFRVLLILCSAGISCVVNTR